MDRLHEGDILCRGGDGQKFIVELTPNGMHAHLFYMDEPTLLLGTIRNTPSRWAGFSIVIKDIPISTSTKTVETLLAELIR